MRAVPEIKIYGGYKVKSAVLKGLYSSREDFEFQYELAQEDYEAV